MKKRNGILWGVLACMMALCFALAACGEDETPKTTPDASDPGNTEAKMTFAEFTAFAEQANYSLTQSSSMGGTTGLTELKVAGDNLYCKMTGTGGAQEIYNEVYAVKSGTNYYGAVRDSANGEYTLSTEPNDGADMFGKLSMFAALTAEMFTVSGDVYTLKPDAALPDELGGEYVTMMMMVIDLSKAGEAKVTLNSAIAEGGGMTASESYTINKIGTTAVSLPKVLTDYIAEQQAA